MNEHLKESFTETMNKQGIRLVSLSGQVNSYPDPEVYGGGCAIPTAKTDIPSVSSKFKVVLSAEAGKVFNAIKAKLLMNNFNGKQTEIGFHMVGREEPDGTINIFKVEEHNTGERKIHYDEDITQTIDNIMDMLSAESNKSGSKFILFLGHTHPKQNYPNWCANSWSYGDLWSTYCSSDRYKDSRAQIAHILITPSLDTNMLFYDRTYKGFYKFPEGVYEKDENGKIKYVNNAYTDPNKQPLTLDPNVYYSSFRQ